MRRFYISIIAVVLGAIFVIGWGVDLLVSESPTDHQDEISIYGRNLDGFSAYLSRIPVEQLPKAVNQLSQDFKLPLSLVDENSVALPSSLINQLSQQGGLYLASEQDSYLYKRIEGHNSALLHMQLPALEEHSSFNIDLMLTILLYIGVSIIIVLWTLPLTRRLHLLSNASGRFGEGDLSARMPQTRFSYIQQLENSFNAMADRIETLLMDNKVLARSLSHDIRTPVACLRFGIEAAMSTDDVAKKDKYLGRMDSEVTRMEEMTNAFLEYAGMERQLGSVRLQSLDLVNWLDTLCNDLSHLANQQQVNLSFISKESVVLSDVDSQWLYRAVQNLISNGIDYANQQVVCILTRDENNIFIDIDDDGEGIAEDQQQAIFDPFVRLDSERSRESGHFGLGLAITAKIMDWHHGAVTARSDSSLSGARLRLQLPV
ncbi:MAG: ATP-binding protein [Psychrobium sp.]